MSDEFSNDKLSKGMTIRREVLGDTHVDRAVNARTDFDARFQELITEGAWGTVWADSTLSVRDRSLLTLALLAGSGNDDEFAMHVRATANTGVTSEELREALLHVAIYCGVPRANTAIKIAKQVYAEMDNAT